jgi:antitoxin component of RelBE/YafQ-DinJ toxin-antitoxin module
MFYRQIIAERRLPFQPVVAPALEEQLTAAIAKRNLPRVKLEADENGNAIIDKDMHPDIYDWAVNG